MNLQTRTFLNEALRLDLTTFIHRSFQTVGGGRRYRHNWHVEAIAYHLEQCFFGNTKRLLITLPPQSPEIHQRLGGIPRMGPRARSIQARLVRKLLGRARGRTVPRLSPGNGIRMVSASFSAHQDQR